MGNTPNIRFKGFTDDWEQRKLGETLKYEQPGAYIVNSTDYDDSYETPVLTAGQSFILGYTNETDGIKNASPDNPVIIFDDFTTSSHFVDFPFKVKSSAMKLLTLKDESDDIYCINNILKNVDYVPASHERHWISIFSEFDVTIPHSKDEQKKIGDYFRNLDNLITLHQRKCDETKKLKKFMLQKMFPKKDEKKPEIRFAGFTDDWEQRKLGDIITEYKETVDSDCTLPILTSSKTEGVILQEKHFGRKQQHDITGYNILPRNYCTYRNRSDGVDFTFNINKCCDKGIISKFYPVFSGKNSDVFFLSLVLNNSEEVVREIAYTCTGTGQKVLSFLDLQKMKVRVPNFDEQKEIVAYFESLDHLITLHQRKCDEIKEIKKFMLQNMFPQKG